MKRLTAVELGRRLARLPGEHLPPVGAVAVHLGEELVEPQEPDPAVAPDEHRLVADEAAPTPARAGA